MGSDLSIVQQKLTIATINKLIPNVSTFLNKVIRRPAIA
jgi:hypothetical protein